jgi:hypothetical protein
MDCRNLTNPNTVILLVGNKKDLEDARGVSYEEADAWAKDNGMLTRFNECSKFLSGLLFVETSAKT